jgi:hypothetical protein
MLHNIHGYTVRAAYFLFETSTSTELGYNLHFMARVLYLFSSINLV